MARRPGWGAVREDPCEAGKGQVQGAPTIRVCASLDVRDFAVLKGELEGADEAAEHYEEQALAILVLSMAGTNFLNRVKIATRQVAGERMNGAEAKAWCKQQKAIAS